MPTMTCPDCGQPLRPGARFCGNCGATLPPSPAPPATAGLLCPHCGKQVRPEARFCNNCGKPLAESAGATSPEAMGSPVPAQEATSGETLPSQPAPLPSGSAIAAPTRKDSKPGAPGRASPRRFLWMIPLLVFVGCGLVSVGGYLVARQFGLLTGQTPLELYPASTVQSLPSTTPTFAPTEPAAMASPTLPHTQTPTPLPTEPLPTATQEILPTETITPTQAILAPVVGGTVLFEDFFDAGLRQHWVTWGEPRATIGAGFGDNWLNLKALDPGQAGVTSRPELVIPNDPGVTIEFDAQMDDKYPQSVLLLDWDPLNFGRGPENQDQGVIRLEIRSDQIKLSGRATSEICKHALNSVESHTFLLVVTAVPGVALYLDGAGQPVCQLASLEFATQPGKISFSGLGWVSRVKVSLPSP